MKKLAYALTLAGVVSLPALAADAPASPHTVTSNVSLMSQYVYRGITQTARNPAVQGGFDYSHTNGFYLGTWGSNISWLEDAAVAKSASLELDIYGGYKGSVGALAYDVGLLQYWYPGDYAAGAIKANTTEVYGALTYGPATGKISYVVSDGLFGVDNADGSWYADVTVNYPVVDTWTIVAHVGHQKFDGTSAATVALGGNKVASYTDWKLGVTKDLGNGWSATAYYTDTNAKDAWYKVAGINDGKNIGDGQFVVGVSRSF